MCDVLGMRTHVALSLLLALAGTALAAPTDKPAPAPQPTPAPAPQPAPAGKTQLTWYGHAAFEIETAERQDDARSIRG